MLLTSGKMLKWPIQGTFSAFDTTEIDSLLSAIASRWDDRYLLAHPVQMHIGCYVPNIWHTLCIVDSRIYGEIFTTTAKLHSMSRKTTTAVMHGNINAVLRRPRNVLFICIGFVFNFYFVLYLSIATARTASLRCLCESRPLSLGRSFPPPLSPSLSLTRWFEACQVDSSCM